MTVIYEFTRGDDFSIPMTLIDPARNRNPASITNWIIASQVRYYRKLISNLNVTITNGPAGQFIISLPKEQTALWPAGPKGKPRKLNCDIQFDRPVNGRVTSKMFIIECTEDQTQ